MNNKISLLIVALLIIAILSSVMVFKVVRKSMLSHVNRSDTPDFFLKAATYTKMDDSGEVQQAIYTSELTHYQDSDATFFQKPEATFVVNSQEMPWTITADSGTSKFGVDIINLIGNVVIHQKADSNTKETTITTKSIAIYFDKKYVETDQLVTITQEGILAEAMGANADFNTSVMNLLSDVKEVYVSPQGNKIYLNSDRAVYDRKKHVSSYFGSVRYTQGVSFLHADKLFIYDNEVDHSIEKIVAFGTPAHYSTVPSEKEDRIDAKAKKIEYYPKKKIALLIEDGELIQKGNKFSGPHITYDLDKKTILSVGTTIVIKP
jgi:LPS export ABC transporter protein LptC/lipopolysaccharide transport protein LptA